MPFLLFSFEGEEAGSTVLELEDHIGEHQVVELHRFEPIASDTSPEGSAAEDADEDSQNEERLHNRDWLAPY